MDEYELADYYLVQLSNEHGIPSNYITTVRREHAICSTFSYRCLGQMIACLYCYDNGEHIFSQSRRVLYIVKSKLKHKKGEK